MNEFEKNKVQRLKEFKSKLDALYMEYHAEVFENNNLVDAYTKLVNEITNEISEYNMAIIK